MLTRLKKMISGKYYKMVFVIMLLLSMMNSVYIAYTNMCKDANYEIQASEALLLMDWNEWSRVLRVLCVFLPALTFSFLGYNERKNNMFPVLQMRYGVKRIYWINLLTCFVGSILVFTIPLFIEMVINSIFFVASGSPIDGTAKYSYNYDSVVYLSNKDIGKHTIIAAKLYANHPLIYNVMFIMLFGITLAIIASFIYSISFWVKKYAVLILLPFYLIISVQNKLTPVSGDLFGTYKELNILNYVFVKASVGIDWTYFLVMMAIIIAVTIGNTYLFSTKDQI